MSTYNGEQTNRPTANFTPRIWGDIFLNYSPISLQAKEEVRRELEEQVEEQFRVVLSSYDAINPLELLTFVDTIERLGVAYRFSNLIEQSLQAIFELSSDHEGKLHEDDDLHLTSLRFRLLRQHGYYVPTDVFEILLRDEEKGCFKESLTCNIQGMLSLYEASHVRVHGEHILDEALEFTRVHLKSVDPSEFSPVLSSLLTRSLNIPLHKAMNRLESRHFISIYEQDPEHNKALLKFAKSEFNLLQLVYKEELMHLSRWWEDMKTALKLPFSVRDRMVEMYFWGLGVLYEPQYSFWRMGFTKTVILLSVVDDTFDAYGTIHELEPLQRGFERWDTRWEEELPQYMKLIMEAFIDTFKEIEQYHLKDGRSHLVSYIIEEIKDMSRSYVQEARWREAEYSPTFDEYMKVSAITFGNNWGMATCFMAVGEVAMVEAFEWLRGNPLVVKGGAVKGRLLNDMNSRTFERKRWHIPSAVECYMKEKGETKEETHEEFYARIEHIWKDMNQAMLRPTDVPRELLEFQLNYNRIVNLIYKDGDGYTFPEDSMEDHMSLVLVNPIPE